jgi:hypothetical protein
MTICLAFDLGFANLAAAIVEWQPKLRKCWRSWYVQTLPTQTDTERWEQLLGEVNVIVHDNIEVDFVVAEDCVGVHHGNRARGTTDSNSENLLQVQGVLRMACEVYGIELRLVRSQSVYAALRCKVPNRPGETSSAHRQRQKLATAVAVRRLLKGTEGFNVDQLDACAIGISACLGKGKVA